MILSLLVKKIDRLVFLKNKDNYKKRSIINLNGMLKWKILRDGHMKIVFF
jgi:hypothetical protein